MGRIRGRIDFARRHFESLVDTQLSAASALITAFDVTCQRCHSKKKPKNHPKEEARDQLLSLVQEQELKGR